MGFRGEEAARSRRVRFGGGVHAASKPPEAAAAGIDLKRRSYLPPELARIVPSARFFF